MSKDSKNISKTKGSRQKSKNKPFSKSILDSAEQMAHAYHLLLEEHKRLGYVASCIEFPTVFADGKSPDECVLATRKALTYTVATMLESGKTPPKVFTEKKRDVQVNIRLTLEEKLVLSQASQSHGFRGLSDCIRACALQHIKCIA